MRKVLPMLMALSMAAALGGCSGSKPAEATATTAAQTTAAAEPSAATEAAATTAAGSGETAAAVAENAGSDQAADAKAGGKAASSLEEALPEAPDVTVRTGSMKGPTSIGLVQLIDKQEKGEALCDYEFTMVTAADELLGKVVNGDLDIALVPANVASVLYNKTDGGISVIDINTLGVLDIVASDDSIKSIADLKGRTLYLLGKGTTPDYVIRYLLAENGLSDSDVTLEYKSEAAEVAAVLKEQADAIGLLPQPFVTAACAQNENLKIVLDLTKEWQAVQGEGGSQLVTGVTVVRNAFLEEYPDAVTLFLAEHRVSAAFANENPDKASELIAAAGIIEKAPIAKKALPYCNITCLTGEEMKAALSGYLKVLFDQDPKSVGGKLPEDGFYYIP